jgi:tetratricopeptide (TPR) repeat protein
MSKLFLSHASANNADAVALRDWLREEGWTDVFLDVDPDPEVGISPGERWERGLNEAASRCEAVLFLVSQAWLDSRWCLIEFNLARRLNKRLFGVLIEEIPIAELPPDLTGTWQIVDLASGRDHRRFRVVLPRTQDEKYVTFSREGLSRLRGGLAKSGLEPRFFAWPPEYEPERAPYRGLKPLEAEDAGIFFGREGPIVEALDALRGLQEAAAPRLFVILGASGAGKSSFLRAGLLPRLRRDDLHFLPLPVVRPERSAVTGEENGLLHAIEVAFAARAIPRSRAGVRRAITGGASTLRPLLAELVADAIKPMLQAEDARKPAIVLAIDQAEELLEGDGAQEGEILLNLVRDLVAQDDPAVVVLFTIRSDSYDKLETSKTLEGLRQHTLPLLPMPSGAYKEVIEGPARRLERTDRAITIQPQLVQKLLVDLQSGGASDALPLLAFTMEQLYLEYGGTGALRLADYVSFGGIKGAITAAVDRTLKSADGNPAIPDNPAERLKLLRRGMIPLLAGIDPETGSPRRRIARLSDIPTDARPLILLLRDNKLLSTDRTVVRDDTNERAEATIEPAHETLLRQWDNLRLWLEEDRALLTAIESVKRAAREWLDNGRSVDWLNHSGTRLEYAERAVARDDLTPDLPRDAREYLKECRRRDENEKHEDEEQRKRESAEKERRARDAEALAAAEAKRAEDAQKLAAVEAKRAEDAQKLAAAEARRAAADRRTLIGASVGFVLALGFAAVAGVWYVKAENSLDTARKGISSFIAATSEIVQPLAQLSTVQELILRARKIINTFPATDDPTIALEQAKTFLILAEIDADRGKLTEMRNDAETASAFLKGLVERGDLEARHLQARSRRLIGIAYADDDKRNEARTEFETAIADLSALLRERQGDEHIWQWKQTLADVKQDLGDVLLRVHDFDAAAQNYDESYDIRVELVDDGHTDPVFYADVAWAANKLADVRERSGYLDDAMIWFVAARDEYLQLDQRGHLFDNLKWPHYLAVVENNIGRVDEKSARFAEAAVEYHNAVRNANRVVERDPEHMARKSVLAWSYDNEGHARLTTAMACTSDQVDNLKGAVDLFSKALEIRTEILKHSNKPQWEFDDRETQANVEAAEATMSKCQNIHGEAGRHFEQAANILAEAIDRYENASPNPDMIVRDIEYWDFAGLERLADHDKRAKDDFWHARKKLLDANVQVLDTQFEFWDSRTKGELIEASAL